MSAYKAKRSRRDAGEAKKFAGKKIIDANQRLSFVVTDADRRKAVPNSPTGCAGACAIKRVNPNVIEVYMHRSVTFVEFADRVIRYVTSHGLRDQLIRHDVAKKGQVPEFDPGSYSLNAVPKGIIAARGRQHSPPDRPRGARNSPHARKAPVKLRHALGRDEFHFTSAV